MDDELRDARTIRQKASSSSIVSSLPRPLGGVADWEWDLSSSDI